MNSRTRRALLATLSGSGLILSAGCLGDELGGNNEQSIDFELQKSGHHDAPADEEDIYHDVRWHNDSEQALASIEGLFWRSSVEQDDVEAFISDTEFDDEELLEIRSYTPRIADDDIEVETLAYDDEEIRGAAHVITTDEMSPAEVGWPSALARYEVAADMPTTMRFEITDGRETPEEITFERE